MELANEGINSMDHRTYNPAQQILPVRISPLIRNRSGTPLPRNSSNNYPSLNNVEESFRRLLRLFRRRKDRISIESEHDQESINEHLINDSDREHEQVRKTHVILYSAQLPIHEDDTSQETQEVQEVTLRNKPS
jgi:hypothetical protein